MGFRIAGVALIVFGVSAVGFAQSIDWEAYTFAAGDVEMAAELGHIDVPEHRGKADSRTIRLAFVKFPATTSEPGPPIVYLAGGPGGSGIDSARGARFPLFMAMRAFGDVIAFDQRGTGQSEPDTFYRSIEALPIDQPASRESMAALYIRQAEGMAAEMAQRGVDLGGYTTDENADDLNDLRKAIGADKIVLWGTSYGTHLAFATIRRHGEHVDKAILHGIEGPDHTDKLPSSVESQLEHIHALAAKDPEVRAKIPDFMAAVREVLGRFDDGPMTINLSSNARSPRNIIVDKFELQYYLAQTIGRLSGIQSLPNSLHAFVNGDFLELGRFAFGFRRFTGTSGMALTMDCASGASPERRAQIDREAGETLLGDAINFPYPELRGHIPVADAGEVFRGPLQSEVHALFISGTLDGRTPVSNAEEMLAGFPNGKHVVIENVGHGDDLFVASPQILDAMKAFMKGDALPVSRIALPIDFDPIVD